MDAFGQSETWAAGLLDAVTGKNALADMVDADDLSDAERHDYRAGVSFGDCLQAAEMFAERDVDATAEAREANDCDPAGIPW